MSNNEPRKPLSRDYATPADHIDTSSPAPTPISDDETDGSTSPRKRLSRVVGKSVDTLTKSLSGSSRTSTQSSTESPTSPRRLFSLNRRRGKESDGHSESE